MGFSTSPINVLAEKAERFTKQLKHGFLKWLEERISLLHRIV